MTPIERMEFSVLSFYNHFFHNAGATPPSTSRTFMKIIEEIGELAETTNKGWSIEEQEKEFGDVLVTVLMHGINSKYDIDRVSKYIVKKLEDRKMCCTVINGMIVKNKDIK